jgi:hypothetical protein
MTGRVLFCVIAVVLDLCAVGMWIGQIRQMRAPRTLRS